MLAFLKICPLPVAKFLVYTGLANRLSFFFKMSSRSLTEVVNELTENKDLRAVFAYIFGTYGRAISPPGVPDWGTCMSRTTVCLSMRLSLEWQCLSRAGGLVTGRLLVRSPRCP